MPNTTYCAALLDAETGGNETYIFDAEGDLFEASASNIVDIFVKHLARERGYLAPITYELDSAIKKMHKQIVLATGSLILAKGDIPFLLMIAPQIREPAR